MWIAFMQIENGLLMVYQFVEGIQLQGIYKHAYILVNSYTFSAADELLF